jgi:biofilm PGA synthesis N-glycosyltransferase PgaC
MATVSTYFGRAEPTAAVRSPSAGSQPLPLSAVSLVFAIGLVFGVSVFALAPFKFLQSGVDHWNQAGGVTWSGFGLLTMGLVAVVTGLRWCALYILSFQSYVRRRQAAASVPEKWPFVSIFVPAFNESETIGPAIESLLALDYPNFEVIVVDDGSGDGTLERALPYAGCYGHCVVRVLRKPNGGKWSAHNLAFRHSTGELVLCLDADSRIEVGSLRRLVARMRDPRVAGVSGQIRVRNRVNLLTRLQGLEYLLANGAMRMAQSGSGTVLVVPGPIGLFRRSVLEEVHIRFGQRHERLRAGEVAGPFEGDTFAEDFDLSLAILALGERIVYEPEAVSNTKAPDWTFALLNQRYRWARGTFQVLRKYTRRGRQDRSLFHGRLVAWVMAAYLLDLFVMPFVYLGGFALLSGYLAAGYGVAHLANWMALFMFANLNAAALFVAMHNDRPSVLAVLPLYDLYHGLLLNTGWFIAAFDEVRGRPMRW